MVRLLTTLLMRNLSPKDGSFFTLNDVTSPNLFSLNIRKPDSPGVCVSASVKLHPVTDDESGYTCTI